MSVLCLLIVDLIALRELSVLAEGFGSRLGSFPLAPASQHLAGGDPDTGQNQPLEQGFFKATSYNTLVS